MLTFIIATNRREHYHALLLYMSILASDIICPAPIPPPPPPPTNFMAYTLADSLNIYRPTIEAAEFMASC